MKSNVFVLQHQASTEILPKFGGFENFDDCIGNITSKSIRLQLNKKLFFSSKKMRNSGNCIHDYAHSFIGKDF